MDTSFGENMVVIYLAVFGCLGIFKLFLDVNSLEIRSNVYWGFVSVAFFIYLLSWNISLVKNIGQNVKISFVYFKALVGKTDGKFKISNFGVVNL